MFIATSARRFRSVRSETGSGILAGQAKAISNLNPRLSHRPGAADENLLSRLTTEKLLYEHVHILPG